MKNCCHLILVPGADGLTFAEDIAIAAERGAVAHLLALPAFAGHPIDDQAAYYADVAALIRSTAERLRGGAAPIFAFGRNLGGSLLGYALATGVELDGAVMIGAIPSLSDFRTHGAHPSAKRFRAALDDDTSRIGLIEPLDLTASLRAIDPRRALLQVGRTDPYMDDRSINIFKVLNKKYNVSWHDDDHAMAHPETLTRRWDFIAGLAAR